MSFSLGTLLFGKNWNTQVEPNKEDDIARLVEEARIAEQERNAMTWRTPMADNMTHDGNLVVQVDDLKSERIVRVIPMKSSMPTGKENFVSTNASQWSTVDSVYKWGKKGRFGCPIKLSRTASGLVVGVRFDTQTWRTNKELVQHWRWLAQNPDIVAKIIMNAHEKKERLRDSALFI